MGGSIEIEGVRVYGDGQAEEIITRDRDLHPIVTNSETPPIHTLSEDPWDPTYIALGNAYAAIYLVRIDFTGIYVSTRKPEVTIWDTKKLKGFKDHVYWGCGIGVFYGEKGELVELSAGNDGNIFLENGKRYGLIIPHQVPEP